MRFKFRIFPGIPRLCLATAPWKSSGVSTSLSSSATRPTHPRAGLMTQFPPDRIHSCGRAGPARCGTDLTVARFRRDCFAAFFAGAGNLLRGFNFLPRAIIGCTGRNRARLRPLSGFERSELRDCAPSRESTARPHIHFVNPLPVKASSFKTSTDSRHKSTTAWRGFQLSLAQASDSNPRRGAQSLPNLFSPTCAAEPFTV